MKTIRPITRVSIFNYKNFSTTLIIPSKALEIKFRKTHLDAETLNELKAILKWCRAHLEIQSIFITSMGKESIKGLNSDELKLSDPLFIEDLYLKIHSLSETFLDLPQCIIFDLKNGTSGMALELAIASDIRLCHPDALFSFDHLSLGLLPLSGMFSFLKPFLNLNILRSLLLSGSIFNKEELMALGAFCESKKDIDSILAQIFSSSPIARVQTKHAFFDLASSRKNKTLSSEKKKEKDIFNTVIKSMDYAKNGDFFNINKIKENLSSPPTEAHLN